MKWKIDPEMDEHYMRLALLEARKAFDLGEIPVGAVIVCQGQVLAKAHNLTEKLHDPTAHAEMMAITSAAEALNSRYLSQCTLYVTLEPCVMCAGGSAWAQVGRLVYGASEEKKGFSLYSPPLLPAKTLISKGVLLDECQQLLKDFFQKIRA